MMQCDHDEIIAEYIRNSLIDMDFVIEIGNGPWGQQQKLAFERKLKKAKVKMFATDTIIKRVQLGELEVKQLNEVVLGTAEEGNRACIDFFCQLDNLSKPSRQVYSQSDIEAAIEALNVSEDEKRILICNKRMEQQTIRKEARLLLDIIFDKKSTHEHRDLLRREYQKLNPEVKSSMPNFF